MARKKRFRLGAGRVRTAATRLLRQAPTVLRLFGRLMTDSRVSVIDKGFVAAVLAYVISPWDLVPDFLAVIGVVDDLFLLGIALDRLLMRAPARVVEDHWEGSPEALDSLTAELTAIGDALPAPIRSVLYGRASEESWGHDFETAEVYEAGVDDGFAWPAAERATRTGRGASRPRRGREIGAGDFDDESVGEGEEDEYGDERMDRYRNRL